MADIVVTTDFSQVKDLNNTLNSTGDIFNKVVDRLLREQKRAERITKAFSKTTEESLDLLAKAEVIVTQILEAQGAKREKALRDAARTNQEIVNTLLGVRDSYLSAESSASAFTEELRKQEAQALETARANQEAFNKQLGVSQPSATEGGAGFGAIEAEMLRLEAMYNKVAVAARVYEQAQESLNRAVMMGVITADEQKAKLEEMSIAYQKVGNSADNAQTFINRFGENAQVAGRGLNNFGMYAQQVGYQVGDFFVQVQSGTNVLVAFGQQATQLAGLIPGVWGAAIGIGISLATALGAAWMRTTENSDNAKKSIDRQAQAYQNLIDKLGELQLKRQMEASGIASEDEQISLNEMNALLKERAELQRQITSLSSQDTLVASQGRSALMAENLKAEQEEKQARIDKIDATLDGLAAERVETERLNRLNQIRTNQVLEELADRQRLKQAHAAQVQLMGNQLAAQHQMNVAATNALNKYGMMRTVAAGVADELDRAKENSEKLLELEEKKVNLALYMQNLQQQQSESQRLQADANQIVAARDAEITSLENQTGLLQTILKYGRDSVQVKTEEARLAKEAYQQEQEAAGVKGNNLALVMAAYDAWVAVSNQVEEATAEMELLSSGMSKAAIDALTFAGIDISKGVSEAARAAAELAGFLRISLTEATNLINLRGSISYSGRGGDPREFMAGGEKAYTEGFQPFVFDTSLDNKKGGGGKETEDALAKLREQLDLETELIGTSEAYQRVRRALGEDFATTSPKIVENLVQQIESNKELIELERQREQLMSKVESSLENGFMAMVEGTKSVKDAFKQMAYEIIKELYRVLVVQRMVGSFNMQTGQGSGIVGFLGKLIGKRESGGTMMPGRPYLVGERGPELVIPRHSGTVVNANQTASAAANNNNGVTVQNNITVTGSDAAMVRAEVTKMIPQITNATKAAVIDARLRGGQMKAAFS